MMINLILWAFVAILIIGTLATIANIGKPKEPTTPEMAVALVLFNGVFIFALIMALVA